LNIHGLFYLPLFALKSGFDFEVILEAKETRNFKRGETEKPMSRKTKYKTIMAKYRFQIKEHQRDDMYKTDFVEIELSDNEYNSIKSDDNKYSKGSSLVSSKIGRNVSSLGFPSKISEKKEKNNKTKSTNNSSLFKPLWALPFKLVWRLIKLVLPI
jgi:hypothetical protein